MTLRTSMLPLEGVYQGSKYLKYHVLCDADELGRLFDQLGNFYIFRLTGLGDGEPIEKREFLEKYAEWIRELQSGRVPQDSALKELLAAAFTLETEALWKLQVPKNRYIVKLSKPVVQVQAHFFTYSPVDEVFRPMTMGQANIFWGLQFSFPQIYQDPKTMEFLETDESSNSGLFSSIKHWVRNETRATPFVIDGKKTNVPIRLGKNCFSWIHSHPQLKEQKIGVYAN